jgi:hypothetical protein
MKVYGQLEAASLENLSTDPTLAVGGRIYFNTTTNTAVLDDGTNKRALLRNDGKAVFGTDATPANNVRFHHAGVGLFQFVLGNDTTTENSMSSTLAQVGFRLSNLAAAPATGNIGRLFFNTATGGVQVEAASGFLQFATLTGTETLTNKTLTAPAVDILSYTDQATTPPTPTSGVTKIYTKGGSAYKLASDGLETLIGSGSGGGAFNYLSNGDFESGISTVQLARTTIINGLPGGTGPTVGGITSPSIALSLETTAPLRNTRSLRITAASAWNGGDGVAIGPVLTMQPADLAKVLTYKVRYQVVSGQTTLRYGGTIGAQTLVLAVYDVTAGGWVPSPAGALGFTTAGTADVCAATFQTSNIPGQQYQLFLFATNASTGPVAVLIDDVSLSPQAATNGAAVGDLISAGVNIVSATTTAPGKGTTANDVQRWRRVGDHSHIKGELKITTAGTAGSGDYLWQLPPGQSFDPNKTTYFTTVVGAYASAALAASLGSAHGEGNGYAAQGTVIPYDATRFRIYFITISSANGSTGNTGMVSSTYFPFSGAESITYDFMAPIAGWSSNVQLSSDTDTRVITGRINFNAVQNVSAGTKFAFNTVVYDQGGGFNPTNNNYVVPVTGFYELIVGGNTSSGGTSPFVYKNGVQDSPFTTINASGYAIGIVELQCVVGDVLDIRADATATVQASCRWTIKRLSGPAVVAASESVNARAFGIVQSITGTQAALVPGVILYDTHNRLSSSGYTVPISGKYRVGGSTITANTTYSISQKLELGIFKNGTPYSCLNRVFGNGTNSVAWQVSGSDTVQCLAGDVLALYANSDVSTSTYSPVQNNYMYMYFERVGN